MRAFFCLACLLTASPLWAQDQGTVHYEITTRMEIELPPELAHMQDQIPSSRTEQRLLHFDGATSLMEAAPREEEDDATFEGGGMRMMFRRASEANALYIDRDEGTSVNKRDFLGRTFLIDGEDEPISWRLTDEQGEFLGYPCMKATATVRDTVEVEAWFTPQIPVSAGPETYGGLPGLILVVTVDDARQTLIAKEVTLGGLAEGTLEPPTEGRRVTSEEFQAIMEEKLEEMNQSRGGRRGRFIIRG